MAQLVKRGDTWYARFGMNGKDVWKSTGETVRTKAKAKAATIETEARTDSSIHSVFDGLLERITGIEEIDARDNIRRRFARRLLEGMHTKLEVAAAWESWRVSPRKRDQKGNTLQGYAAIWSRFTKWLTGHHAGVKHLHEITETMAEAYAADLWQSKMSPATYNAHTKFLRTITKTLSRKAGVELNPWETIVLKENESVSKRELTPEELAAVCSTASGEIRYWLAIGLYTGLRLGDVLALRWENIDFQKGLIEVQPMKTERKRRTIRFPLHPVLKAMLLELRNGTPKVQGYLFPDAVKAYQRDRASITRRVQMHFEGCGIRTQRKLENGHRRRKVVEVGFHSLRHSFVSLCAANQVPEVAIMEMVGHGSPAMTRLYSHAGDELKARAIAALPDVDFSEQKARVKK